MLSLLTENLRYDDPRLWPADSPTQHRICDGSMREPYGVLKGMSMQKRAYELVIACSCCPLHTLGKGRVHAVSRVGEKDCCDGVPG